MKKTKSMCEGCYNDFYNQQGNSTTGECWMFAEAEVTKKVEVHINETLDRYKGRTPITTLSCFRKQRYVYFKPGEEW